MLKIIINNQYLSTNNITKDDLRKYFYTRFTDDELEWCQFDESDNSDIGLYTIPKLFSQDKNAKYEIWVRPERQTEQVKKHLILHGIDKEDITYRFPINMRERLENKSKIDNIIKYTLNKKFLSKEEYLKIGHIRINNFQPMENVVLTQGLNIQIIGYQYVKDIFFNFDDIILLGIDDNNLYRIQIMKKDNSKLINDDMGSKITLYERELIVNALLVQELEFSKYYNEFKPILIALGVLNKIKGLINLDLFIDKNNFETSSRCINHKTETSFDHVYNND